MLKYNIENIRNKKHKNFTGKKQTYHGACRLSTVTTVTVCHSLEAKHFTNKEFKAKLLQLRR